jgi:K+-transporting ATPase A subunit
MAFSIAYWQKYTALNKKLSSKSENAVECNRVLKFKYDTDMQYVTATVQASMRDRCYAVTVSIFLD